ncbi:MAG: hypothetical protein H0Z40_00680 [Desulfotomaculum sp.]|nr:hypothetical protein [Desulfotomaculum sp.]
MRAKTLKARKKKLLITAVIILALLSILVWITAGITRPLLLSYLVKVDTLEQSIVSKEILAAGLLIKKETLLRSPTNGSLELLIKDGERVPAGTAVAKISNTSLSSPAGSLGKLIYAPKAGIACTHIDGLEEVLTPDNINVLELSQIHTIKADLTSNKRTVNKSQPVVKLIDNLEPLIIRLEFDDKMLPAENIKKGNKLKLKYRNYFLTGRIMKCQITKGMQLVVLAVQKYPNEILHLREINFSVLSEELAGLLVPEGALVYRENHPGIYRIHNKRVIWVPVQIQGKLEGKAAVKGSALTNGVRYVLNPELVKEGDLIL